MTRPALSDPRATLYEAEFVGGHVSLVIDVRRADGYMIGLATREDGKCRCVFFTSASHHPDPWITAVRAAAAYHIHELPDGGRGKAVVV